MSYEHGLVVLGYVEPDKSLVLTPGVTKDEMERVMREGTTLDSDVKSSNADPAFKTAWSTFWDGYRKFYADNTSGISGWFSRGFTSVYDQTISYGNLLNDWRNKLKSYGAQVTEPTAIPKQRREDPTAINWKYVLAAGGAIAGLAVVGYAASKIGTVVSAARKTA